MADTAVAHVHVEGLAKRYPGQQGVAVEGVSFSLARGEMLALLGPSGCGKTTVLRMIAGLVEADAGRVHIAGRALAGVPVHRRNIGMVFQSYALFPHLSVAGNVGFGLEMQNIARAEREQRVREALALVRLEGLQLRAVRQLSGGQQQRVALARALASRPDVLLLDEPLSNLDAKLRDEMRVEIRRIQKELGMTAIFVTHDQDEALSMADRVAVMHQGRIVQFGAPREVYEQPADAFVADFIGHANLLQARLLPGGAPAAPIARVDGLGDFALPAADPVPPQLADDAVLLALRPHRLEVHAPDRLPAVPGGGTAVGAIETVAYRGHVLAYGVRAGGRLLQAEVPAPREASARVFAPGDPVVVSWPARAATWVGRRPS